MSKKFTITTLVLLASLGMVASGCVKKPQAPVVNQNQNVNTNTATTTAEVDTSNWKTYKNEEYGFEFKYPENGTIILRNNNKDIYVNVNGAKSTVMMILLIDSNVTERSIKDWLNKKSWKGDDKILYLGDLEVTTGDVPTIAKYQTMSLLHFLKNGKVFEIEWYGGEKEPLVDEYRIFVSILNTLSPI